jgi:hypothetical protein
VPDRFPPIQDATRAYEAWLARLAPMVPADLDLKHEHMRTDAFRFLRGTFYRWQQIWPVLCGRAAKAPRIAAIGDLHVDNFGTWRDTEGRLVWGINDFDEAAPLPFTNDLTRLATSALLAIGAGHLSIARREAIGALLDGYVSTLGCGGAPVVLEGDHHTLRKLATGRSVSGRLPRGARKALRSMMPKAASAYKIRRRIAGVGSLGRARFVAIADYHGAPIAREAKARVPSACVWGGALESNALRKLLDRAVRVPDPYFDVRRRWVVRRLAPDCSRIEIAMLPAERDEHRLLHAMGKETANAHLATSRAKDVFRALRKLPDGWLEDDAATMLQAVEKDWNDYRAATS